MYIYTHVTSQHKSSSASLQQKPPQETGNTFDLDTQTLVLSQTIVHFDLL